MTEILAVLALVVLRLGVPLVVIFGLSYLVYRWLGEEKPAQATAGKQPNAEAVRSTLGGLAPMAQVLYAGPHCWDVKGCSEEMKAKCPTIARPELPCWLAVQMKTGHLRKNCFNCDFYARPVPSA